MSDTPPEADRSVSAVASRRKPLSKGVTLAIGGTATAAVIGFIFWANPGGQVDKPPEKPRQDRIGQSVAYTPPPVIKTALSDPIPKPAPALAAPVAPSIANTLGTVTHTEEKKPQGGRMYSYAAATAPAAPTAPAPEAGAAHTQVAFKGAAIPGARAGAAMDQTYMLMPGVHHCVLDTAVQSDLPGPILCHMRDDALSPSGVTLMERGTRVIGDYKTIEQGQERIQAVSGYAITPFGVPVPLDSPMTDGLGRAGLPGEVDHHLLARFGGGVTLALVDSALGVLSSSLQSRGSQNFNFGGGGSGLGSIADDVLRNQINRKNTVTANQGDDVGIFIHYPIDFSDAYRLVPR